MPDRGPIDDRHPAMFFCREGYNALDQQLIQLPPVVEIIRVQRQAQSFAQLDLLLREIFEGSDTSQAQATQEVRIVKVRVYSRLDHVASPFVMASGRAWEWSA